jgi:POT family proton-dependent oligopeptide transporter
MEKRTAFPAVFWIANTIEVLERFAYYGIYMGFGIYMTHLGFSRSELGVVQSLFLMISYVVPVFSGTFADRFGFKKVLIVSYLAYLPSILLLLITESFTGIALTMLSIGLAAGIFKPLISGTVRAVTDGSNKTLGFGIFYAMVNVGASFGPIVAGKLRAISWNHAFMAAAIGIGLMLVITIFFYKEPPRQNEGESLRKKFKDMYVALSDMKFLIFLLLLGIFFWLPFWAFFNLVPMYVDNYVDTAALYTMLAGLFGAGFAGIFSSEGKVLGETISHTGYIIMIFQVFVSRIFEKRSAIPSFLFGLFMAAIGLVLLVFAKISLPALVFLGIAMFAVGEMISSPRIQEYITWIAPKEKAGLYMGTNFLPVGLGGALSGVTYTSLYGYFENTSGNPEYIWVVMAAHLVVGIFAMMIFTRTLGEFKEMSE